MRLLAFTLTAVLLATSAHAQDARAKSATAAPACKLQESVSINVNFNLHASSFAEAKQKFDEKMKKVAEFAAQQKIAKFELQSMSYNINTQGNYEGAESGYQMNGSANYQLSSSEDAFKLGEFLTQQKFQVSVNGNSYRNGNCNNMMQE